MSIGPNSSLIRALCHGPLGTEARVIRRVSNEVLAAHSTHACMPSFTLSLSLSSYIYTYVYKYRHTLTYTHIHINECQTKILTSTRQLRYWRNESMQSSDALRLGLQRGTELLVEDVRHKCIVV